MTKTLPPASTFRRYALLGGLLSCLLGFWLSLSADSQPPEPQLNAGAYVQDVTPPFDSLLINGGFLENRRGKMAPGDLSARCFVLQRGAMSIAIAVVDSCMLPRDVCDQAKALASEATGIPVEKIVIAATHTHSAPSTMDYCLGTMADPAYTEFLPGKIAEGIAKAYQKMEPAQVGWQQVKTTGFTHCRRWITRPDQLLVDPFGEKTVRAMMHPGFQNPNYIGPSGPADDELSVLSIQALDGSPLGVLANFSMHYHGGGGGPADYFGLFSDRLAKQLAVDGKEPVCAMTQGTSGDLYLRDYSGEEKASEISSYTDGLVQIAKDAVGKVQHQTNPPLDMDQQTLTLSHRLPDTQRLEWADKLLAPMEGRRPQNQPEVYAEQARYLHENPTEELILQTVRIGDLGITMTPNEVYAITGLKLKARSPFDSTFNIELANGASGYIPPPEQHALGGYTTWPARTAGLEVEAEPKIVEALLTSLESLSGKPRRKLTVQNHPYSKVILADKPLAYWQCEEFDGSHLSDASGNNQLGQINGVVAYHLAGPESETFADNGSIQLAGGSISTTMPKARTLSFWFWNGMVESARDNTGDLVQAGDSLRLRIGGKADEAAASRLIVQDGEQQFRSTSKLALHTWHHVLISHDGTRLSLFLDGNPTPEIQTEISPPNSSNYQFGGTLPFEGRLDEIAFFDKPMDGNDAKRHYDVSGMTRPAQPVTYDRDTMRKYAEAVAASRPAAYWRLQESGKDNGPQNRSATFEQGAAPAKKDGDTFTGGRLRAEVPVIGDSYSIEFWFRNSLSNDSRPVTAYLFSRGIDGMKDAEGDHLGIGGTHTAKGKLIFYQGNHSGGLLIGQSTLESESWHHVAMTREGDRLKVYLNGNPRPEIDDKFARTYPKDHPQFFFGGRTDNFANLQGRLDEIAIYDRVLSPEEISVHYKAVELIPVANKQVENESGPLPPSEALTAVHVPKGYRVELVAAEPLVQDPVAIDWSADGKLWVAEMADYPSGIDGQPGGRVRFLEDLDGDGKYDKSTLFLEGLNFPAGIMSWKKGVLIAAAPDIIYAEDSTGDGKADIRKVIFTGFKQGNQQLRVNGLSWGLDNWVHGANGSHFAGYAKGTKITSPQSNNSVDLESFDFRIQPDLGVMEPLSGPSQFGRTRDDWGNAFGVQNSHPLWHYVLEQRYLTSNPDYPAPDPRRQLRPTNAHVFPASQAQKRYHSFDHSDRFTSACSPMIYRDDLLFDDDATHAFTCEPYHNLVQHVILKQDGYSFTAERAEADDAPDFFASADRWSRPVMARTGPDGALWVVDMYRYMIEHPDWLPDEGKEEMKSHEREGSDFGRIYRILPKNKSPRPVPRLDEAAPEQLVSTLSNQNGIVRDLAHRLLVEQQAVPVVDLLLQMVTGNDFPQARLHALCVLDGLDRLDPDVIRSAFADPHPQIRRHALRLAESRWQKNPDLLTKAISLLDDPDPAVRLQAACSLGTSQDPISNQALIRFGAKHSADVFIRALVFNSALANSEEFTQSIMAHDSLIEELITTKKVFSKASRDLLISHLSTPGKSGFQVGHLRTLGTWLDRHPEDVPDLNKAISAARKILTDNNAPDNLRAAATALLGRQAEQQAADQTHLATLLSLQTSSILKNSALEALARIGSDDLPDLFFKRWPGYSPQERTQILDILLRRENWTLASLQAIAAGLISHRDFDTSRQQLLLTHQDSTIRETAERVLNSGTTTQRKDQINPFRAALELEGNEKEGKTIFDQRCAVCHLPPNGQPVNGPDLRAITERTKDGLFSSILDPNQSVDPTYTGYSLTLADGSTLYGRVLSENANHLTLRLLDGSDRQLPRHEIKALKTSGLSLMPEGLETGLSPQNLADLIRFLQSFGSDQE